MFRRSILKGWLSINSMGMEINSLIEKVIFMLQRYKTFPRLKIIDRAKLINQQTNILQKKLGRSNRWDKC